MKKKFLVIICLLFLMIFTFVKVDAKVISNFYNTGVEESILNVEAIEDLKIGILNEEVKYSLKIKEDYGECDIQYSYDKDKINIISNNRLILNKNSILEIKLNCTKNSISMVKIRINNNKAIFNYSFYVYSEENYVFVHEYGEESIKKLGLKYLYNNKIISKIIFEEKMKEIISIPSSNIINDSSNIFTNNSLQDSENNGVKFTGKIQWQDRALNYHNYVDGVVSFYEITSNNEETFIGTSKTDNNGCYVKNIIFNDNKMHKIKIRVYAESDHIRVLDENNAVYCFESDQVYSVTNNSNDVSYNPMIKNISQRKINSSMQVYQAMLIGYKFIKQKFSDMNWKIDVKLYTNAKTRFYHNSHEMYIEIGREDYNFLDVLLHEYSHYIADVLMLDDSPGGEHSFENLADESVDRDETKEWGIKLAWGEGLATFLGIIIQKEVLGTSSIVDVCDDKYSGPDAIIFNLETLCDKDNLINYGEAHEGDVAGVLYDIYDTYDGALEPFDNISLSIDEILEIIKDNNCTSLSDFTNAFITKYPKKEISLGEILFQSGVTAYDIYYTIGKMGSIAFNFKLGGGSDYYPNNKFSIVVFDENYNKIYETNYHPFPKDITKDYGYYVKHKQQFTSEDAKNILYCRDDEKFYFGIYSLQTDDVITGKYLSTLIEVSRAKVVACAYGIEKTIDCKKTENITYLCNSNSPKYIGINSTCLNSYDLSIKSESNFNASIYDENMNLLEYLTVSCFDSDNIASKRLYIDSTIFYIKILLVGDNLADNVNINIEPRNKHSIENLVLNTMKNIELHKHNVLGNIYYQKEFRYKNIKSGFYDLCIQVKKSDGSTFDLPEGSLSVYDNINMLTLIDRFTIQGKLNKASSRAKENTMSIFLHNDVEYFIKVNIPSDIALNECEIIIKNANTIKLDIFEDDGTIDMGTMKTLFNESEKGDCIRRLDVNQPGVFSLDVSFSKLNNKNIMFLLFKASTDGLSSDNEIELVEILKLGNNSLNYTFSSLSLDEGTYYIGYYNLDNDSVDVSVFRYIDNSIDEVDNGFQIDPNSANCGSQIRILENNRLEAQKSYNSNIITIGFTRLIYFNNSVTDAISRLDYYWYSSDDNIASVTNYGTVLGKSEGIVTILAVLKSNPRIIYKKQFIITDNSMHDIIQINLYQTYSLSSENKYVININSENCPYAQLSLYDWSISNNQSDINSAQFDNWYRLSINNTGEIVIIGNYNLNSKVSIRIFLNVID